MFLWCPHKMSNLYLSAGLLVFQYGVGRREDWTEPLSRKQIGCLTKVPPVRSLRVRFFWRIHKRICDVRSYGFFTTKKTEDPKKDRLLWQRHVLVLLKWKKKQKKQQQQTDPHGEDKKKKQHKLGMNIRNVYIENTSWKVLAYGFYARVVDVLEIERLSTANE